MARKQNSWLIHVKKTLRENRDKSFKQVLKLAKKTYKKSAASASSKGVRKSRRYNKTKRGGKLVKGEDGVEYDDGEPEPEPEVKDMKGGHKKGQSGGNQHEEKLPQLSGQKGGSSNPLMDMVKSAGQQKGGSGVGGGGSKSEFGANAGSV